MLNGIAPIILFSFKKKIDTDFNSESDIPIISDIINSIPLPPIPIYLDEKLTGIVITSESKAIDIETSVDTKTSGATPDVNQKGISSMVTIKMIASRNSIGVTLLSTLADIIFSRVTSKEYSVTYLHGAVTVFGGLLHTFQVDQSSDNDLYELTLQISSASKNTIPLLPVTEVSKTTGALPL